MMGIVLPILKLLPTPLIWLFARPYVAGDSLQKALDKVEELWQTKKICSTVDLLGEEVYTKEEVEEMVDIYLQIAEGLRGKARYATISLKPTALGITLSRDYCVENISKILDATAPHGIGVTMDMEDHTLTQMTLDMYRELRPKYPHFGTVLQTRLHRTEQDIKELPAKSHVRLCIGIYLEPKEIALTKKSEMKERLVEQTGMLVEMGHFTGVATHDEKYLAQVLDLIGEKGVTKDQLEFQMLLGVPREKVQQQILEKGFDVRLYVPFATKKKYATAYALRRFVENPNMGLYMAKNLWSLWWVKVLLVLGVVGVALLGAAVGTGAVELPTF